MVSTGDPLWPRRRYTRGKTVYRAGGTWRTVTDEVGSTLYAADVVPVADRPGGEENRYLFLGGRRYSVSAAVQSTIQAAGVGGTFS